jgi:hypothetical protein
MKQVNREREIAMRKIIKALLIPVMVGGIGAMPLAAGTAFATDLKPIQPQTVRHYDGNQVPPQVAKPGDGNAQPPQDAYLARATSLR